LEDVDGLLEEAGDFVVNNGFRRFAILRHAIHKVELVPSIESGAHFARYSAINVQQSKLLARPFGCKCFHSRAWLSEEVKGM
jgi:hypothetical protein